jgi:LysM repeat protein
MNRRFFDLSTLFALGIVALLFISLPGGCGDSENGDDEEDIASEEVAEPTAPPMMDIVDPEPGDLETEPVTEEDDSHEEPVDDEEGAPEPENGAEDGTYVVQDGDTLYDIAVRFGVTMEQLMEANNMDNPDELQLGQELQIPE